MRNILISIFAAVHFQFQIVRYNYLKWKNYREIERDMKKCGFDMEDFS